MNRYSWRTTGSKDGAEEELKQNTVCIILGPSFLEEAWLTNTDEAAVVTNNCTLLLVPESMYCIHVNKNKFVIKLSSSNCYI